MNKRLPFNALPGKIASRKPPRCASQPEKFPASPATARNPNPRFGRPKPATSPPNSRAPAKTTSTPSDTPMHAPCTMLSAPAESLWKPAAASAHLPGGAAPVARRVYRDGPRSRHRGSPPDLVRAHRSREVFCPGTPARAHLLHRHLRSATQSQISRARGPARPAATRQSPDLVCPLRLDCRPGGKPPLPRGGPMVRAPLPSARRRLPSAPDARRLSGPRRLSAGRLQALGNKRRRPPTVIDAYITRRRLP